MAGSAELSQPDDRELRYPLLRPSVRWRSRLQLSGGVVTRKALRPARGTLDDALAYHCGALIPATREESPHNRPPQPSQPGFGPCVSDNQRSNPDERWSHMASTPKRRGGM